MTSSPVLSTGVDALNAALKAAESFFAEAFSARAEIVLQGGARLAYAKVDGAFGLHVAEPAEETLKHVSRSSLQRRVEIAGRLEDLWDTCLDAHEQQIRNVDEATKAALAFVAERTAKP